MGAGRSPRSIPRRLRLPGVSRQPLDPTPGQIDKPAATHLGAAGYRPWCAQTNGFRTVTLPYRCPSARSSLQKTPQPNSTALLTTSASHQDIL